MITILVGMYYIFGFVWEFGALRLQDFRGSGLLGFWRFRVVTIGALAHFEVQD